MSLSRISIWCLSGFSLLAAPTLLRAELDKDEKEKKAADAAKAGLGDDKHGELHDSLIEEGEKTLEEINKLLEQIQNDLGSQQTGEATQGKQKQVVERLEKLIKDLDKG